jgi:isoleucyl-tRNA synthetase
LSFTWFDFFLKNDFWIAGYGSGCPELEEEILQYWQTTQAFEKSVEMRSREHAYVFYDGPPFATGLPHYGHLLAFTTKD